MEKSPKLLIYLSNTKLAVNSRLLRSVHPFFHSSFYVANCTLHALSVMGYIKLKDATSRLFLRRQVEVWPHG